MMSMPMLPNVNVPVHPSLRIGNTPCPTNMPPPAPTAAPFSERLVNVVCAPVLTAARTLTKKEKKEQEDKVVKKELTTNESTLKVAEANQATRWTEHEISVTEDNSLLQMENQPLCCLMTRIIDSSKTTTRVMMSTRRTLIPL
jgi:hypothetical protein